MRFYGLGLYSKGNTFSRKMIIGKIFADAMNFATMTYGGGMGGRMASNGYGSWRKFIIFMKNPHF